MWTMRPASQPPTVLEPVNLLFSASGFKEQVSEIICNTQLWFSLNLVPPVPVDVQGFESSCVGYDNCTVSWIVN